jgi:hypothetical protein
MKKILMLLMVFAMLIPISYALSECAATMSSYSIPCFFVTYTPSNASCDTMIASFYYGNGTLLGQTSMGILGSKCYATFNYSAANTYLINVTNGDYGKIIVTAETYDLTKESVSGNKWVNYELLDLETTSGVMLFILIVAVLFGLIIWSEMLQLGVAAMLTGVYGFFVSFVCFVSISAIMGGILVILSVLYIIRSVTMAQP